jgi:hypothetical protein
MNGFHEAAGVSPKLEARSWRNHSLCILQKRTPSDDFTCKIVKVQSKIEGRD